MLTRLFGLFFVFAQVAEAASSGTLYLGARVPATTRVVIERSRFVLPASTVATAQPAAGPWIVVSNPRYTVITNQGPRALRTKIDEADSGEFKVVTITPQ